MSRRASMDGPHDDDCRCGYCVAPGEPVLPEVHEAVVATGRARAILGERARIIAQMDDCQFASDIEKALDFNVKYGVIEEVIDAIITKIEEESP